MDDILVDLKQTPEVLDLPIPRYFYEQDEKEFKRRDILLEILLQRHNIKDQSKLDDIDMDAPKPMTAQEAILIIQKNERARQGRATALYKRNVKRKEEKIRRQVELGESRIDMEQAATIIQKLFRGYFARKQVQQSVQEELQFLGMIPTELRINDNQVHKLDKTKALRKLMQVQNKNELEQERVALRERILKEEGPKLVEDMHDAILERIILYRQTSSQGIPPFPSEDEGGSKKFMIEDANPPPVAPPEEDTKKDKKKKDGKEEKKEGKKDGKKDKKKKDGDEPPKKEKSVVDGLEFKFSIAETMQLYLAKWFDKENQLDFAQKYDSSMLRTELMNGATGIEEEVRKKVDNTIRDELANLELQVEGGKKKDKRDKKGGKKKDKKDKKSKKELAEEKAKQAEEDKQNAQKYIEPILNELISLQVVKKYPKVKLMDYIGTHRILGSVLQDWAEPSMGQVRQCIAEVILSMGSLEVHAKAPHIKSILIYGPEKTGKTMLARAIATELNATFFDLTPDNVCEKYESMKDLMKMVLEVAKSMQPAVIYIRDIELVFKGKKKSKRKAPAGVTKLKKEIVTHLSALTPEARVLVVCESTEPFGMHSIVSLSHI